MEKITKMTRAIMPSMANVNNTLFGGQLLSWMDEITGIAAARYAGSKVATVAVENVVFKKPIYVGEFIDIEANIESVGNTSIRVKATVKADRENGDKEVVAESVFVYVALDKKKVVDKI